LLFRRAGDCGIGNGVQMRGQSRSVSKFRELAALERPCPDLGGGAEGFEFRRVFRLEVFNRPPNLRT
jgi:hypothetical protein